MSSRTMIDHSDNALPHFPGMADVGDNESFMSSARNSSIINHNHFENPHVT